MPDEIDILETLTGRTITRAIEASDDAFWVWLDDGRVVEFSSHWCNDSTATGDISEVEVLDIVECHHCGRLHPDSRIYRRKNGKGFANCTDGTHLSTVPDLPVR